MPVGSPSTSISTPALSLRTEPASPSATACRYTNGRKPTPCTVPVTRSSVRGHPCALSRSGAAGRRRACRRCGCRRTWCAARRCPRARPRSRRCGGAGAERVGAHGGRARRRPPRRGTTATHLALVGDVQRIDARAGRRRRSPPAATGSGGLVEHDGQAGVAGQLVAHGADAAAGRVAQPAGRRRGGRAARRPARPRGAVSERMSASSARSPRASITAMPWSAMRARDEHDVARLHAVGAERRARPG